MERGIYYLSIGIIGTTITPWMQFYLQSSIAEKGSRRKTTSVEARCNLRLLHHDIISFFIIVTCATILFQKASGSTRLRSALALKPFAEIMPLCCLRFHLRMPRSWARSLCPRFGILHLRGDGWEAASIIVQGSSPVHGHLYHDDRSRP